MLTAPVSFGRHLKRSCSLVRHIAMDQPDQATLKKLWTSGRHGTLCPMELMKAWGIAWAMKHHYKDDVN